MSGFYKIIIGVVLMVLLLAACAANDSTDSSSSSGNATSAADSVSGAATSEATDPNVLTSGEVDATITSGGSVDAPAAANSSSLYGDSTATTVASNTDATQGTAAGGIAPAATADSSSVYTPAGPDSAIQTVQITITEASELQPVSISTTVGITLAMSFVTRSTEDVLLSLGVPPIGSTSILIPASNRSTATASQANAAPVTAEDRPLQFFVRFTQPGTYQISCTNSSTDPACSGQIDIVVSNTGASALP